ncbi:hypothetical protein SAMN05660350_03855 [Geodermatophilus obscurus]|uniref:Uncharacterized protein n=1 Tax=Geodermatophilus obscurus TaxID=1861 RepID=A0A1M7UST2_9ACTN|nr:hypothetical protein [Geodermatophilus obscurus]SHN85994.1 hypothetical protein SAMN05660350_03855 [Geodermatophilus obscurus]
MSSPVQERTAGRSGADAVGIDPVGRAAAPPPVQDSTHLPDLASRSLGGSVFYADDELFAERENLIEPEAPSCPTYTFGHEGDQEGGPDGGAADDVLPGRPTQGLDALPDAVRALPAGGAR